MEQALRARSLSSASARRKRIQERQEEREKVRADARKRALALQELSDEDESESASASDENMAASNHSREDSVETLSEYSPMTPQDASQPLYENRASIGESSKPSLQIVVPERTTDATAQKSMRDPSPAPKLQASLTNFSDFQYDRFSIIVDTPVDILQSPVSETDEPETPCEVATPISYTTPHTRPAVISIISNRKRRTSSSSSSTLSRQAVLRAATMPPEIPTKSTKRLSQMSSKSGFLASEAAPLSVPELPRNAMYMIANASRDSLAISTHSTAAHEPFQRHVQTRKNSMPLLSAAFKSGHARLNSIKGFVSPTLPSPTSSISHNRPESQLRHHAQPSISLTRPRTAVAASTPAEDLSFETVPADLNEPLPPPRSKAVHHRPSTSHASTRSASIYSMTALPTPPPTTTSMPNPLDQSRSYESHESHPQPRELETPSPELSMRRKKSFSALRKRSESISNAIKFVKKGGSSASPRETQPPPTPAMPTLSRTSTVNGLLDVARPNAARSSTGGFMGYGSSNTTGSSSSYTKLHGTRKSIDLLRSFGGGHSSSNSRSDLVSAAPSTTTTTTTTRPTATTATTPMPRSSMRGDAAPRSPGMPNHQPHQSTTRVTTPSYSVFPSSRGEHGRSVIGLGIRT